MGNKFSGSALYAEWVYSGGTVALQGNFRTFTYNPAMDFIDSTAGSDSFRERLDSVKDGNASWTSVMEDTETSLQTALLEGTRGTLNVGPAGTASGKPKLVLPMISGGLNYNIPYNDVVELTVNWQHSGARTDTTWS